METRTILVLLGLLAAPCLMAEEAYVWTDENGVVHYSDRPMPGAKRVELHAPNTSQSPSRQSAEPSADGEEQAEEPAAAFRYESFEVATPGPEETLWNIEGTLNVTRLRMTTHPVEFDMYYSL